MRYGLIGEHLGHSYSPFIHSLLGSSPYQLVSLPPEELGPFIKAGDFAGLNVTIPYKKAVMPYLDHIAPEARAIGAVNTIVRRPDGLWGYNTDYQGFLYAAERAGISLKGKKVLVLGSGGASAAVQAAAAGAGAAEVLVVSRTGALNYENVYAEKGAEIIVNATPVGTYPGNGASPVDLARLPRLTGVADLIYNPKRTALLLQAETLGIPCTGGLTMLAAQALRSSELFQGRTLDPARIPAIVGELERSMRNIILIGMPGSGKTTVAEALARALGRPMADADALVEKTAGETIPAIFARGGEELFRQFETAALAQLGKQSGLILATGGGCVTREENYPLLRQNGTVFWLRRDPGRLSREGRPLSERADLRAMYTQREPLYRRFADHIIDNNGPVADTVARILEVWQ